MNLISQIEHEVFQLLKFKIQYSENHNTYLFNNRCVNEIEEDYYAEKVKKIKKLLQKQFKYGLNHEIYLKQLSDPIWDRVIFLGTSRTDTPEFLNSYMEKILNLRTLKKIPASSTDLFEQYQESRKDSSFKKSKLFSFLASNTGSLNDFQTPMDFENGLLLYAINNYSKAINSLHSYIFILHSDAKYIDFKNLDFEESIQRQEKEMFCHFNLDKKSVAHLFLFLLAEKIIVFDEINESKNELKMKQFVEANFTYQNTSKDRVPIKTFSREYSEVRSISSSDVKKHKQFIDSLNSLLQQRKNRLKD